MLLSAVFFTPENTESITNKELVKAYNSYAETYNSNNKVDISRGNKIALELSNLKFHLILILWNKLLSAVLVFLHLKNQ